mgnify:CR=1 FL=1
MEKSKKNLKNAIKSAVVDSFERMKTLNHEDRFHVMLEIGEWFYNDLDEEIYVQGASGLIFSSRVLISPREFIQSIDNIKERL